ncbi:SdpA family antimicrobial peptide system protein [Subtercola endophyticus]|uniref:SdpA family antimicrobial peptide system protein n=1 Tax=Subtercola endophyticus TaxID=2895559 RepID=UPI001E61C68B|nr:SdpA family antimicrobial peptide system protein [Subtercola endophyticus]UFS57605.1 SdpA family antimicrobial peptide system protein [Subtercola endophyticus]
MTGEAPSPAARAEREGRFWLRIGVPFVVSIVGIFGFLLAASFFTLPSNVVATRTDASGARLVFNLLASENFAFFTRDPESPAVGAYAVSDGQYPSLLITPQNLQRNLFGLTRTQRAQGPEIALLANNTGLTWTDCAEGSSPESCLTAAAALPTLSLSNSSPVSTVCGDVILTQEQPVEWSFRNLVPSTSIVQKYAHVDVQCHG